MTYIDYAGLDDDGEPILNEYSSELEYKIELWLYENNYAPFHEESIKYIFNVRKEIIDSLNYNNSEVEKVKSKIIKFIENKYIFPSLQTWVAGNIVRSTTLPDLLKDFQKFKYKPKNEVKKIRGKSQSTKNRYLKVYDLFRDTQEKHDSWTKKEIYQHISTKKIGGKKYSFTTIRDIIEKKKYLDTYEDK